MNPILNHLKKGGARPPGVLKRVRRTCAGAGGDRAFKQARRLLYIFKFSEQNVLHPTSHNSQHLPSRHAAKSGFSVIEVMVSAVLAVIVVWTAGTQIINVLRYHNEYRIDAILLEDLTRVANGVQSRIEMCTNWVASASGGWEGGFPIQINGVAFETNRFTNVKQYQIVATNGAFVETLIRNPKEGWRTNTVIRSIANQPGIVRSKTELDFESSPIIDIVLAVPNSIGVPRLVKSTFSATAEWRWAGRTHTNRVTVPRMIVLYNRN